MKRRTITSRPRGGYGLFAAVVQTSDGRRFEGFGSGPDAEQRARRNALAKAREAQEGRQ